MLALNVFVRVKHGGREELLEAVRVLFDELAKEPTFLDATGNLGTTDRVALFMMDYPHRSRLKLPGHARVLDVREHSELADQLAPESLRSKVQRLFLIQVISYDWNCPQYITPRFTAAEMEKHAAPLKARIAELEALLAAREGPGLGEHR